MFKQYKLFIIGISIFVLCLIVSRFVNISQFLSPETLKATVDSYGSFGPLVYILFYIIASFIFVPGTPLTLAGGALFGPFYGTIYTVIGATLGAGLAFFFVRIFGGELFKKRTEGVGSRLASYDEKISKNGLATVLFLRLVPLFPFNGLNFAFGLTHVKAKDYLLGTFLGIIPGTFAFVYFGDSLASLNIVKILIAVGIIVGLSLGGKYIIKKFNH